MGRICRRSTPTARFPKNDEPLHGVLDRQRIDENQDGNTRFESTANFKGPRTYENSEFSDQDNQSIIKELLSRKQPDFCTSRSPSTDHALTGPGSRQDFRANKCAWRKDCVQTNNHVASAGYYFLSPTLPDADPKDQRQRPAYLRRESRVANAWHDG